MEKDSTPKKKTTDFVNSIKPRMIAIMLLVAAIPLIISVMVSYISSTSKAVKDAENTLNWQANYIQSEFEGIMEKNIMSIQTLAKSPATTRFMETPFNVTFQDEASKYLQEIDTMLNDGNITVLTGKDGNRFSEIQENL